MPENTVTAPLAPMEPGDVAAAFAYIRAMQADDIDTACQVADHTARNYTGCSWTSPPASSSPSPLRTTAAGSHASTPSWPPRSAGSCWSSCATAHGPVVAQRDPQVMVGAAG
ncbi:hypothetical protein [Streptomyces sp. NPDC058955]|uniref:hypothetical protein n=1 Tax=unclassified Streptomyces TaxID=2593676 RepID=UPI00365D8C6E